MARAGILAAAALLALGAPRPGGGQTVAPPLVEYQERALSSFSLVNDALVPMTVVLEPFAFTVDSVGALRYGAFDSAGVSLRLSATSLRLPPRGSATINYEVSADSLPRWFVVTSTFTPPRSPGINVRAQLPHVVYLYQKEPLRREDVVVNAVRIDSVGRRVLLRVENRSGRLGRMMDGTVRPARGDGQPVDAFPLFPHYARWFEVPWTSAAPPARVRLEFEGFVLEQDLVTDGAAR